MDKLEIDERFIEAGKIAATVREHFKKKNLVGMTVTQLCNEVEGMTRK